MLGGGVEFFELRAWSRRTVRTAMAVTARRKNIRMNPRRNGLIFPILSTSSVGLGSVSKVCASLPRQDPLIHGETVKQVLDAHKDKPLRRCAVRVCVKLSCPLSGVVITICT